MECKLDVQFSIKFLLVMNMFGLTPRTRDRLVSLQVVLLFLLLGTLLGRINPKCFFTAVAKIKFLFNLI